MPGQTIRLDDGMVVTCVDVHQRNWSRVGTGAMGSGEPVFLKQHVTAGGSWQPTLWTSEQQGHAIAERTLSSVARIPHLIGASDDILVNAFEFVRVRPMDELLRSESDRFDEVFRSVIERMTDVLAALIRAPGTGLELARGAGSSASANPALNFKGFDIRNVGLTSDSEVLLFDFGRPYVAPIGEAAAKLLVSIGMLNWGRPLRRFARGVDILLLEVAKTHLDPFIDRESVVAEIALQRSFRFTEVHASNAIELALKRAGLAALGRKYMRELEKWCSANVALAK